MYTPDNAADFNNDHVEHCDVCDSAQMGTEWYCNDAMGMATPVLWTCHRCDNPPVLVGLWRSLKVKVALRYGKVKYLLTTTKEQRAKRRAHVESVRARYEARKAEREAVEYEDFVNNSASVMGLTKDWK